MLETVERISDISKCRDLLKCKDSGVQGLPLIQSALTGRLELITRKEM